MRSLARGRPRPWRRWDECRLIIFEPQDDVSTASSQSIFFETHHQQFHQPSFSVWKRWCPFYRTLIRIPPAESCSTSGAVSFQPGKKIINSAIAFLDVIDYTMFVHRTYPLLPLLIVASHLLIRGIIKLKPLYTIGNSSLHFHDWMVQILVFPHSRLH